MEAPTAAYPTIVTERRIVPNLQPALEPYPYRIAIVGEAPGEHEENYGYPFVGPSGQFLERLLLDVGLDRRRCFVGNICQVRPPANDIERFDWNGIEIQSGLKQLTHDLTLFKPNLCVLLGATPLRAAKGSAAKITAWRGSLFRCQQVDSPFVGTKCVASLHPAFVLREFSGFPLLKFDLTRAAQEGNSAELVLPYRELITNHDAATLIHIMDNWPAGQRCSVDIEGGLPADCVNDSVKADAKQRRHIGWRCVSLSGRPTRGFTIAWWKFTDGEHAMVLQSFARLMAREDVPKVLQNSLYDNFVLSFGWRIPIRNVAEDTMLKGWEVYSELPKGLSTLASIWTREPHWKDENMYESTGEGLAVGCAKDSAVTLEICNAQDSALTGPSLGHYRANVSMLNPLLYMELRGIKYDTENVKTRLEQTRKDLQLVGESLNQMAGTELRGKKGSLSAQRLAKALYETKGYPPQYKKEEGRKTDKLTTDVEAILTLRRKLPGDKFLSAILRHRHLEGLVETLEIKPDTDGRVRCGYNVVGTETGRLTCYTSPTGAGANLQTITKELRNNYIADSGYDFFQCDLSGADGWTVAAHCARLGDPTMLEDYNAGLKPAKIIALLYAFGSMVNELDRSDLKFWTNGKAWKALLTDLGEWVYMGCKRVQHGSNYLMGIPTMLTQVMKDSHKESGTPIYLEHHTANVLQGLYHARYKGIRTWHSWAQASLGASGTLTSPSGQTRVFFGRRFGKNIHDTVKEFLSHEPQSTTTWATNLAMLNLWNDPENRRPDGSLIIEPLHQVHDALCGQWPSSCRDWARGKVRSYFNNPLTIAGIKLVIPFEGTFGPSWGDMPNTL